jgi:hypothetical protein
MSTITIGSTTGTDQGSAQVGYDNPDSPFQTFTAPALPLTSVTARLKNPDLLSDTYDNIVCRVHGEDSMGSVGTLIATSDVIAASTIGTSYQDVVFTFATPVSLVEGNPYTFKVTDPAGSMMGYLDWQIITDNQPGLSWVSAMSSTNDFASQLVFEGTLDAVGPTVGTAATFSSITADSMDVTWGIATDETSAQADLQYKLVKAATAEAIDTVGEADAISGADLLMDWTANTLTKSVTGLSSSTTYFFTVLVKDEAGNQSIYAPVSQATLSSIDVDTDITVNTSIGDGATLILNAKVTVKSGAVLTVNTPDWSGVTFGASGAIVIEPSGTISCNSKEATVLSSTLLKIKG